MSAIEVSTKQSSTLFSFVSRVFTIMCVCVCACVCVCVHVRRKVTHADVLVHVFHGSAGRLRVTNLYTAGRGVTNTTKTLVQ